MLTASPRQLEYVNAIFRHGGLTAAAAVLAPDHPLATRQTVTLAEISACPPVLTDQDQSIDHMRNLFSRSGLPVRIVHRCASQELMRPFAANGLGVGLSYSQPAPRLSPDGKPFVLRPVADAGTQPIILAIPARAPDPADLSALQDILARILALQTQPVAPVPQNSAPQSA